jgi:hypothetical protein
VKCVICTGITGSERREYIKELEEFVKEPGKLHIMDPWQQTKRLHPEVDEATFLRASDEERLNLLHSSVRGVASSLEALRTGHEDTVVVVPIHSVLYWQTLFKDSIRDEFIEWLSPDMFVTIDHELKAVKENLDRDKFQRFPNITLAEITKWRQREIEGTKRWAGKFKKPHFVIARNEPIETLHGVLFTEAKKIYFCYPTSYVSPSEVNKAKKLLKKLRSMGYTVFDPGSVGDEEYISQLSGDFKSKKRSTARSKQELLYLARTVSNYLIFLHYRLIGQSDMVVVRYPPVAYEPYIAEERQAIPAMYGPLSAGVLCEMARASEESKKVLAVWLPRVSPSPFFSYHCSRLFSVEQELLDYLQYNESPL